MLWTCDRLLIEVARSGWEEGEWSERWFGEQCCSLRCQDETLCVYTRQGEAEEVRLVNKKSRSELAYGYRSDIV